MIVSQNGDVQPNICTQDHWAMFNDLRRHHDLFDPLHEAIVGRVDSLVGSNPRPYIDSRQMGAEVLGDLSSWWNGEFPRRFPNLPNGCERGLHGMTLWYHLAMRPDEWWTFTSQPDSHGYGQPAMQYWLLQPNDPLIPQNQQ